MEGSTPWLELLLGISGAFRPKVLTCLMGVTGAGKTTLMDVLAGRKTGTGDLGFLLCREKYAYWWLTQAQKALQPLSVWFR